MIDVCRNTYALNASKDIGWYVTYADLCVIVARVSQLA
jgi:hypothetical protein